MNENTQRSARRRRGSVPFLAFAIGALVVGLVSAVGATAAQADTSTPSAVGFNAQPCAGETFDDPTDAGAPVPDLTSVFGERLVQYQAGNVVALYDAFGDNSIDAYPPVCGVRFVAGVGAVSEWMFCTDIASHACAGTDALGNLVGIDGQPILPMKSVTGNPKLTAGQEKIVAWLIQNGHSYQGTGYYNWGANGAGVGGVTEGFSDAGSTSYNRLALQTLIWCISDAPDPTTPVNAPSFAHDRLVTCTTNMGAAEQARILAMIPDQPAITLAFTSSGKTLELGQSASFSLTTNLYNQPISLGSTGVAGQLAIVSGSASIANGVLTVTGSNPAVQTTVILKFTAGAVGTVTLDAAATPASRSHIGWNQSPSISSNPSHVPPKPAAPCQVFATFHEVDQLKVGDNASATFAAVSTPKPTETPTPTPTPTVTPKPTPTVTPTATPTPVPTAPGSTGTPGAPGTTAAELAHTGANLGLPITAGLILAAAGTAFLLAAKRRRRV